MCVNKGSASPSHGAKTIAAAANGDNAADEFHRFAEGFLPGNSLWFGRLAFERVVKDQLTELADPDVRQKFQRAERKAK